MSSNTDSYFFKPENSTLTVEDIRSKGYIAGTTSNGFIEVTFNESLDSCLQQLGKVPTPEFHKHEEYYQLKAKELETFLMSGLKKGTPRLMQCLSSSFGSCMDDCPVLIAYNLDGTKERTIDNYMGESEAEALFLKEYNASGYYDTVGFIRDTTDHRTEEQKSEIELLRKTFEDQEYKKWKDSQEDLNIARISLLALSTARKGQPRYSYGNEGEYKNLDFMERFIKEYYNIPSVEE